MKNNSLRVNSFGHAIKRCYNEFDLQQTKEGCSSIKFRHNTAQYAPQVGTNH